jgi:hypothetical protein
MGRALVPPTETPHHSNDNILFCSTEDNLMVISTALYEIYTTPSNTSIARCGATLTCRGSHSWHPQVVLGETSLQITPEPNNHIILNRPLLSLVTPRNGWRDGLVTYCSQDTQGHATINTFHAIESHLLSQNDIQMFCTWGPGRSMRGLIIVTPMIFKLTFSNLRGADQRVYKNGANT